MRAMPSPTESTLPVSETSTPGGEPAELLADDPGDLFGANVHACSGSLCFPDQPLAQRAQPPAHAAVVDLAVHAHDQPAQDLRAPASAVSSTSRPLSRRSALRQAIALRVGERVPP